MNEREEGSARSPYLSIADRRDALVAAAMQVMKRDGVKAATTRAICAEAGMPHGAFHYCFHSKRDLYAALLSTDANEGLDLGDAWSGIGRASDIAESIQGLLVAYWNTVEADPAMHIALSELTTLALRNPDLRELARQEQLGYQSTIAAHLERFADAAQVVYTISVPQLAQMMVAAFAGVTSTWLSLRDDQAARDTIAEFARVFAAFARREPEAS